MIEFQYFIHPFQNQTYLNNKLQVLLDTTKAQYHKILNLLNTTNATNTIGGNLQI